MKHLKHRILATLGAILVLTIYFALAWWLMWEPWKLTRVEWTPAEKAYYAGRNAYHKIPGSICPADGGRCYFYRDGKRCRL